MNARPASVSTPAHNSGRVVSAVARRRQSLRVPLAAQIVPIAGAFVCSYLLYGRIASGGTTLGSSLLAGMGSFVALFVELRIIDDLDDLERDHPAGQCTVERRSALRARLLASVAGCMILIIILNFAKWHALTFAAAATALAFAAPFGFKRLFPHSLAMGFFVFEGAPFLIFMYCYFFWRDAGGLELPFVASACVAGLFWTGYEFWKFSRKVHTDAMQPYFLSARGIRAALNAFLVLALVTNVALARFSALSDAYAIYAAALPLAWLAWLNASWSDTAKKRISLRRPLWAGMTFVGALELGLLVELLPALGSK